MIISLNNTEDLVNRRLVTQNFKHTLACSVLLFIGF